MMHLAADMPYFRTVMHIPLYAHVSTSSRDSLIHSHACLWKPLVRAFTTRRYMLSQIWLFKIHFSESKAYIANYFLRLLNSSEYVIILCLRGTVFIVYFAAVTLLG